MVPCAMQVEGFDEVERAFVHVDYERREEPEHKVAALVQPGLYAFWSEKPLSCSSFCPLRLFTCWRHA